MTSFKETANNSTAKEGDAEACLTQIPDQAPPSPGQPTNRVDVTTDNPLLTTVATYVGVSLAATWGYMIRFGLYKVAPYTGFIIYKSMLAQIVGTFIIGFVSKHQQSMKSAGYQCLYVAIATGLCGSVTTFSSWQLELSNLLLRWPVGPVYFEFIPPGTAGLPARLVAWATVLALGLAAPYAALVVGRHAATLSPYRDAILRKPGPTNPEPTQLKLRLYLAAVAVLLLLTLLSVSFTSLTLFPYNTSFLFAVISAPFGASFRFFLSRFNKSSFPWGTFIANSTAVLILTILRVLLLDSSCFPDNQLLSGLLLGLSGGLCGCLSTVSTFVSELSKPRPSHRISYVYGTASVLVGQAIPVFILGGYIWFQGDATFTESLPSC